MSAAGKRKTNLFLVLLLVLTFCRVSHMGWLIAVFTLAVVIPFVYSYWLHARKSL